MVGNADMGLHEINAAAQVIYDLVNEDANIILGSVIDPDMEDEITVTVIATGLDYKKDQTSSYMIGAALDEKTRRKYSFSSHKDPSVSNNYAEKKVETFEDSEK
jgi:cell division protein FtsZ